MNIHEVQELSTFADDYERVGINTAEDLASMSCEDIAAIGIGGIGSVRAAKHITACKLALNQEIPTVQSVQEVKPVQKDVQAIASHPAMSFLSDRLAEKVMRYAEMCPRITDPVAWLDKTYERAVIGGTPEHTLQRFANNLELRLV